MPFRHFFYAQTLNYWHAKCKTEHFLWLTQFAIRGENLSFRCHQCKKNFTYSLSWVFFCTLQCWHNIYICYHMYMKFLSYDFFHIHRRRFVRQIKQFIKYVSVGGFMLIINLAIVWCLIEIYHMQYLLACSIAFTVESLAAFFINKYWTFRSHISFRSGFKRFFLIGFYTTLVILFITYGLTHYLAFHYAEARTTSTVIMGIIGYFIDMRLSFRV